MMMGEEDACPTSLSHFLPGWRWEDEDDDKEGERGQLLVVVVIVVLILSALAGWLVEDEDDDEDDDEEGEPGWLLVVVVIVVLILSALAGWHGRGRRRRQGRRQGGGACLRWARDEAALLGAGPQPPLYWCGACLFRVVGGHHAVLGGAEFSALYEKITDRSGRVTLVAHRASVCHTVESADRRCQMTMT